MTFRAMIAKKNLLYIEMLVAGIEENFKYAVVGFSNVTEIIKKVQPTL